MVSALDGKVYKQERVKAKEMVLAMETQQVMARVSELEMEWVSVLELVLALVLWSVFAKILLVAYNLYKDDNQQQSHL